MLGNLQKMFEIHPGIRTINENVNIVAKFSFSEADVADIRLEIKNLNSMEAGALWVFQQDI